VTVKTMTLDLDREIAALDEPTAVQFKQAVFAMLQLVKAKQSHRHAAPFSERISKHPAIGTWPAYLDADKHVNALRDEWDR
jgi:hypothetical protein